MSNLHKKRLEELIYPQYTKVRINQEIRTVIKTVCGAKPPIMAGKGFEFSICSYPS